jgi:hypothetical protein
MCVGVKYNWLLSLQVSLPSVSRLSFLSYVLGIMMPALWVHQDLRMLLKIYLQMEALHSMGLPGFVTLGRFSKLYALVFLPIK